MVLKPKPETYLHVHENGDTTVYIKVDGYEYALWAPSGSRYGWMRINGDENTPDHPVYRIDWV
jgi:hypothetical protein